ncbi:MAG: hypothetical protein HY271_04480 [Deltaproteobacteria bacterium]|nr:hypothetical protein [Deltaproteobacteria bacterium]
MTSNLGTRAARDLERELARAYDGEVPPPYYWQLPAAPPRPHGRRHPGEMPTALPYSVLPAQLGRARAVSLEEIEELVERRARREELAG